MSTRTRRQPARAAAVVAILVVAAGGCTSALRSDSGPGPAPTNAAQLQPAPPTGPTPIGPAPSTAPPGRALGDLDGLEPIRLDVPEFGREPPVVTDAGGLSVVAQNRNEIVDTAAWFRSHRLEEPRLDPDAAPADVPRSYRGAPLAAVLRAPGTQFLLYGAEFEPTLLVAVDPDSRQVAYALDLGGYAQAPEVAANEEDYVTQAIGWAQQVGSVLYVSTGHRTYASSSGGMNAYLTAIDIETDTVLWRSAPLVANAGTFEIVDQHIVTGYGFTAEPDWLYLLDRDTGAVSGGIPLASGPEHIRRQGEQLLVRCYDTDYVLAVPA